MISFQSYNISDSVYEMEWQSLHPSSIKLLLILMSRSAKPLEFTVGYVIPVNIETFIKVRNLKF